MYKSKKLILSTFLMGLIIISSACVQEEEKGRLELNLTFLTSKTILPGVDMNIGSYEIFMSGTNGEANSAIADSSGSVTVDNLAVGTWQITVTALNPSGAPIGSGQGSVEILPRETVACSIIVTPYEGEGTLNLTFTWDSSQVGSPSITGTLYPAITSVIPIEFILTGGASTYSGNIPAGYYTLSITLYDNGFECGGAVDVVRIAANETTEAAIEIIASANNGSAGIIIIPEMNDPIEIILTGAVSTINEGGSFTVYAQALNAPNVVYGWYIDGKQLASGNTINSINIPTSLSPGLHRLDVTIFSSDGLRGGSTTFIFEVL